MRSTEAIRAADLARDCAELATAVAVARTVIGRGGEPDLEKLRQRLAALLEAITVSTADPQRHRRLLLGLAEEIETLGGVIAAEGRRLSDELARSGPSARAAAAYDKTKRY